MLNEKAFFRGKQGVGGSDNGAKRGAHLQGDDEEDAPPEAEVAAASGLHPVRCFEEKLGAEAEGDEPEGQSEESHEADGVRGLTENPGHRSEADEQKSSEARHQQEQDRDLSEPGIDPAKRAENVKAGQADQEGGSHAEGDFKWRGPELLSPGKGAQEKSEYGETSEGGDGQSPRYGRAGLSAFVEKSAGFLEEILDDAEKRDRGVHRFNDEGGAVGIRMEWRRCVHGWCGLGVWSLETMKRTLTIKARISPMRRHQRAGVEGESGKSPSVSFHTAS